MVLLPDLPSTPTPASPSSKLTIGLATLPMMRPLGAYQLHGLVWLSSEQTKLFPQISLPALLQQGCFLALDSIRGYLLAIPPGSDSAEILNPDTASHFIDARGLWLEGHHLWFCRDQEVLSCRLSDLSNQGLGSPVFTPQVFTRLPYPVSGVAVAEGCVYVACQKSGYIQVLSQAEGRLLEKILAPGIGEQNLTFWQGQLWVSDQLEQSVYCLNLATKNLHLTTLTPFVQPTALAFANLEGTEPKLFVAYAGDEPYLRENPNNREDPLEIAVRDATLIHAFSIHQESNRPYTLSSGYLLEMAYVEEIAALDPFLLTNLEWQIALPSQTDRQRVLQVEPIGRPYEEKIVDGERVAFFQFPELRSEQAGLFGWKARLEVRGIKYHFDPAAAENCPPLSPEFCQKYLVDDDNLAMDHPMVQAAAREAVGTETNLLRKALKIRNFVYDRLSYALTPLIDTPDVVLERGVGSCGEYVGLLLALFRLNGIACRTAGRYKCPPHPDRLGVPLQPDYNHVWLEFYLPGFGWLPMESNPDDVVERGPYPTRFFMGLPWYHIEIGKGIRFETTNYRDQGVRLGDLALNHIRFKILAELPAQPAVI